MYRSFLCRLRRAAMAPCVVLLALMPNWALAEQTPVRVFAAASLKTALDEIIQDYEKDHDQDVIASYAGSSSLARQIALGAPADIFISANIEWMEDLATRGFIVSDDRVNLLSNRLVVVAGQGATPLQSLEELPAALGSGRLALAQPDAVPAGIYAKAALSKAALWDAVEDKIAPTDNVRSALALVATRATPFGIVYATDAHADPRVSVVFEIPEPLHPPIVYPAARIAKAEAGAEFFDFLQDARATAIFKSQGFTPLDAR
ncbi:molybdate ABC transporter substrate-binding protein [Arenibacterium sp. LLYu02]|uniref:molybdate ABC transporter substrate-binding protein n=1 Tax=Arenibacterium sp. LLYu02 TaxID=3404132 RepID=UPI003B21806D